MKIPRLATLLLVGGLAMPLQSQDLKNLHTEENPFKYIPEGETCFRTDIIIDGIENQIFTVYWHDKNHNEKVEDDEMFIDINKDYIPDMILRDFMRWYYSEKDKE